MGWSWHDTYPTQQPDVTPQFVAGAADAEGHVQISSPRGRAGPARRRRPAVGLPARADRLVFLDETWVKTNMTRLWGRALKGERLVAAVPHGHWKTMILLAALRSTGLSAPLVIDGAVYHGLIVEGV